MQDHRWITTGAIRTRVLRVLFAIAALMLSALAGAATAFPERAVRLVVPYPPGGSTDAVARILAQRLSGHWGKPVVVENQGGAGGLIGTELVAKAAADGHTLLMGTAQTHALNHHLYAKLPYDAFRDFVPVSLVATTPLVLVVHPSVEARSVLELVALAKKRPNALNFASTSSGGTPHLAGELFKSMAGIELVHVPYRGSGPAVASIGGTWSGIGSAAGSAGGSMRWIIQSLGSWPAGNSP